MRGPDGGPRGLTSFQVNKIITDTAGLVGHGAKQKRESFFSSPDNTKLGFFRSTINRVKQNNLAWVADASFLAADIVARNRSKAEGSRRSTGNENESQKRTSAQQEAISVADRAQKFFKANQGRVEYEEHKGEQTIYVRRFWRAGSANGFVLDGSHDRFFIMKGTEDGIRPMVRLLDLQIMQQQKQQGVDSIKQAA